MPITWPKNRREAKREAYALAAALIRQYLEAGQPLSDALDEGRQEDDKDSARLATALDTLQQQLDGRADALR